jgi:hypothetical protein
LAAWKIKMFLTLDDFFYWKIIYIKKEWGIKVDTKDRNQTPPK